MAINTFKLRSGGIIIQEQGRKAVLVATPSKGRAPVPEPKQSTATASTYKESNNHIRGKIFESGSRKMNPSPESLARYEKFIERSYEKALAGQLDRRFRYAAGTHKNVGKASGRLIQSIKSDAIVKITRHRGAGKINISYTMYSEFLDYGELLKYNRPAGAVPHEAIYHWIKTKVAQGSFRIKFKTEKGSNNRQRMADSESGKLYNIAWAIVKKFNKEGRQPVLKNWNSWDRNDRLRAMFNKEVKTKGSYYRSQIRKSIVKNINS